MMHKIRVGDVFLIAINDEKYGIGQVIARYRRTELYYVGVYDHVVQGVPEDVTIEGCFFDNILFLANTFDAIIADGGWPVIGNEEPSAGIPFPSYKVSYKGKVVIENWAGDVRREPKRGESELLDNRGGVAPVRLEKALRAHHGLLPWHPSFDKLTRAYVAERCVL